MTARVFMMMTALLLIILPSQSRAAPNHITATLLSETPTPKPGETSWIAVRMVPETGWHGYWKNPGDAGVGTLFKWSLPVGVTVGDPRYPVPERLVISGLMNHVYNGEHALLLPLIVPTGVAPGTPLPLKVELDWLACTDRICVPEHASLALDLRAGNGEVAESERERFDTWLQKLPHPLGAEGRFQLVGNRLRVSIPLPDAVAVHDPHLFAETEGLVNYGAVQTFSKSLDAMTVELDATGTGSPAEFRAVLAVREGAGFEIVAKPGAVAEAGLPIGGNGREASDWSWSTIFVAMGGALLGGLLLNIMPCVFPIISLKALSLARAGGDEGAAKREALAYTVGVVVTCLALGGLLLGLRAGGVAVGWAFQLQSPWMIGFLLVLAIAITLNLAGLFHLRGFGGGETLAGQGGTKGAFWTGALAAFVATPCTGPFMAAALGAALVLPAAAALAIFAGLGVGLASPFLAIAFVPAFRNRMPRPGAWMQTFQRILAIPMALTALALGWLLWTQVLPSASAGQSAKAGAIPFSEARLTALRAAGKPVFLYFTADWCLTCKVNEKAALERGEVEAAFMAKGITTMVGDWTTGDAAITRFLEGQGRSGVPYYVFYPVGGKAPEELPQILTPSILLALQ